MLPRRTKLAAAGIVLVCLSAGALRVASFTASDRTATTVSHALQRAADTRTAVSMHATVAAFPEAHSGYQRLLVRAGAHTYISVRTERGRPFAYGDTLAVRGKVRAAPDWMAPKGIAFEMIMPEIVLLPEGNARHLGRMLSRIRASAAAILARTFPEPQSAYATALLIGDRSGISYELSEIFRRAGTSHIVALSGFNITLIVNFLTALFVHMSIDRRKSFGLVLGGIAFFVLVTGASATVLRAGLMGALMALAYRVGRQYSMVNALALAAAVMLFAQPRLAAGDIGFQLSFAATIGMASIGYPLIRRFAAVPNPLGMRDLLLISLGVEMMVLPLLLYHFGQVAALSIVTNLLILPLVAPLTVAGYIVLGLGALAAPLAQLAAYPVSLALSYQLAVMRFFAGLPFAVIALPPIPPAAVIALYGCLGLTLWWHTGKKLEISH